MNTMTKTYNQLTEIFKLYQKKDLSPFHPLINELVKYEDILDEISEMTEDLSFVDVDDVEEQGAFKEEIANLEKRKKRQWSFLMESFSVNEHYWNYLT